MGNRKLLNYACGVILLGVIITVYGCRQRKLADATLGPPERITLSKLEKRSGRTNAHVIVTDFYPALDFIAIRTINRDRDPSVWAESWIPLLPRESPQAKAIMASGTRGEMKAPRLRVVLRTDRGNERDVLKLLDRTEIQGILTNSIDGLDEDTARVLAEHYPDQYLGNVILLHEGRLPPDPGASRLAFFVGCLILLGGVIWAGFALFSPARPPPRRRRSRRVAPRPPGRRPAGSNRRPPPPPPPPPRYRRR